MSRGEFLELTIVVIRGGGDPMVRRPGPRRDRQSVPASDLSWRYAPHRSGEQRVHLPGGRAGSVGRPRALRYGRDVSRRGQGARRARDRPRSPGGRRVSAAVAHPRLFARDGLRGDPPRRCGATGIKMPPDLEAAVSRAMWFPRYAQIRYERCDATAGKPSYPVVRGACVASSGLATDLRQKST
jgi:hypothetical protein